MASYEAAALNLVDVFYPDQLTHYLWAGTCLRYRPTPAFLAAAERRIADCPAKFDSHALTLTLW